MPKDPAFLFYPGDASEDTQFMNRLERGCYFDILKAQKRFRRFTLELLKKVLGQDFETCWAAIKPVLAEDADGYYIEWVEEKIQKREAFSESRRRNRQKKTSEEQVKKTCETSAEDMVNGNGNGNENEIEEKLKGAFDEIYLEQQAMKWPHLDFDFQLRTFIEKVRGSPKHYHSHDSGGLRLALQKQLREAKPKRNGTGKETPTDLAFKLTQRMHETARGKPPG